MTDYQEQNWIRSAGQGDQAAFEELVRRYEKRVYALAVRMCGDPEDAAEAAQEAFLSAWQGLPFFRGDAAFSTWLYRLTSNACVDLLRREGRHRAAAGPSFDQEEAPPEAVDPAPTPPEAVEQAELREEIQEGLLALPDEYRAALILRELHQLSYQEIADTLSLDLGTVKSRISRGRRQLRDYLVRSGNFSSPPPSKKAGKEGCI